MFTHTIAGNMMYKKSNPDLYAPVGTDGGDVSNLKWPLGLSSIVLVVNKLDLLGSETLTNFP